MKVNREWEVDGEWKVMKEWRKWGGEDKMIYSMYFILNGALGYYLWRFLHENKTNTQKKWYKWLSMVILWVGSGLCAYFCYVKFSGTSLSYIYYVVTVFLLVSALIDLQTLEVPIELILTAGVIGLLSLWFNPNVIWYENLVCGLAVLALMYCIHRLTREAIGLGDVCLVTFIAVVLGWEQAFVVLLLALVISGLCGAVLLAIRKVSKKTLMPFIPFIAMVQLGLLLI